VELQLDLTVEVNAERVVLAVTHEVPRSEWQGIDGNAGASRRRAETPCQNDRAIWGKGDQEALGLFWQHRRVICRGLMDVGTSGLEGPHTWATPRELTPRICCCFMSGDLVGYTERDLRELGAAAVLPKPFRLAEVAAMLWERASRGRRDPLLS